MSIIGSKLMSAELSLQTQLPDGSRTIIVVSTGVTATLKILNCADGPVQFRLKLGAFVTKPTHPDVVPRVSLDTSVEPPPVMVVLYGSGVKPVTRLPSPFTAAVFGLKLPRKGRSNFPCL
jgi:hypothetical protein